MLFLLFCLTVLPAAWALEDLNPTPAVQPAAMAPEAIAALGIQPLLDQLGTLEAQNQKASLAAFTLRQLVLEHILAASLQIDSVLGRIESEASFSSEDRYVLEMRKQRQTRTPNVVTFAAGGALGAAGSAMQLTNGLNHAGVALQAASDGSTLILSSVQLKITGGRLPIRTPYNMLAELLDQPATSESHYPSIVEVYLHLPRSGGRSSIAASITATWQKLDRLKTGHKAGERPSNNLLPIAPATESSR